MASAQNSKGVKALPGRQHFANPRKQHVVILGIVARRPKDDETVQTLVVDVSESVPALSIYAPSTAAPWSGDIAALLANGDASVSASGRCG